jgi:hypothetical protein
MKSHLSVLGGFSGGGARAAAAAGGGGGEGRGRRSPRARARGGNRDQGLRRQVCALLNTWILRPSPCPAERLDIETHDEYGLIIEHRVARGKAAEARVLELEGALVTKDFDVRSAPCQTPRH